MGERPKLWDLQRSPIHQRMLWTPPEPLFIRGIEFSEPQTIRSIRLSVMQIATTSRADAAHYDDVEHLSGATRLWVPRKRVGFEWLPGALLEVELAEPLGAGHAELWLEPLEEAKVALERMHHQKRKQRAKIAGAAAVLEPRVQTPPASNRRLR